MRRFPPGSGLIVLAAAAVPFVVEAAKPLAKAVGKGLKKFGEMLEEASVSATPPDPTEATQDKEPKAEPKQAAPAQEAPRTQAKPSAKKKSPTKKAKASTASAPKKEARQTVGVQSAPAKGSQAAAAGARRRAPRDIETG